MKPKWYGNIKLLNLLKVDIELLNFLFSSAQLPILGHVKWQQYLIGNQASIWWVLSLSNEEHKKIDSKEAPGLFLWFERKTTGQTSCEPQQSPEEGSWQKERELIMLSWVRSRKSGVFSNGGQQAVIEGTGTSRETVRKPRMWEKSYFGFGEVSGEEEKEKKKRCDPWVKTQKIRLIYRAESWSSVNNWTRMGFLERTNYVLKG